MCNLYSLTKGQAAIRDWFRAGRDRTGNLPLFPGIFPDQMAPIVRNGANGERELVMARWGMPGPPQFGGAPITNIRNVGKPALARLARQAKPLRCAGDFVLRVPRHQVPQGSPSIRTELCSLLLVYGPRGVALEGQHQVASAPGCGKRHG